jgi:tRNA (mo5U34)-methyltransferase
MKARAVEFARLLDEVKATAEAPQWGWYPYKILPAFIDQLDSLLTGESRRLFEEPAGKRIADIGAADGDLGFFLETVGFQVDLIDGGDESIRELRLLPPRLLMKALDSKAEIYGVDLDHDFELRQKYDLIFYLGVLYHLKNPMLSLEVIARSAPYCILSTKVAKNLPTGGRGRKARVDMSALPVAYLFDAFEVNPNDDTNYWVFSEAGLKRTLKRTGWEVLDFRVMGNPEAEPASEQEARAWCLLRSNVYEPADG